MAKTPQEVTTVLGTDIEHEQLVRNFATLYWTLWMVSFPVLGVGLIRGWHPAQVGMMLLAYGGLVLLLLNIARWFVSSELILDHERQELMLRQRRFFFFVSHKPLMGAEDLWGVTWAGELPQAPFTWWWEYVTLLVTRQGRRFRAFRIAKEWGQAEVRAQDLAKKLGIPFHKGKEAHRLSVEAGPNLQFRKVPVAGLDLLSLIYWGFFIIPGTICMYWALTLPFTYGL